MKLHFFTNTKMFYDYEPASYVWLYIQQWQKVAPELGVEIIIGPSEKEEKLNELYRKQVEPHYVHAMPGRDGAYIEIDGKKTVFLDVVDDQRRFDKYYRKVKGEWVDIVLKCQYYLRRAKQKRYSLSPFKIVPFTHFTDRTEQIYKYRPLREQVMKDRSFKYSMIWSGMNKMQQQRKMAKKWIKSYTKKGITKWWNTIDNYFEDAIYSMVGIGVKSLGQFSSRDFEYF